MEIESKETKEINAYISGLTRIIYNRYLKISKFIESLETEKTTFVVEFDSSDPLMIDVLIFNLGHYRKIIAFSLNIRLTKSRYKEIERKLKIWIE